MALGSRVAPLLQVAGAPIRLTALTLVRLIRPVAGPAAGLYGLVSPPGDRALMARPEIRAMFLDDLLNGSRKQLAAPFYDIVAFARDWGFRLDQVKVPVLWWHGDADHIVPYRTGSMSWTGCPTPPLSHAGREPPRRARACRGDPAFLDRGVGSRGTGVGDHPGNRIGER